MHEVTVIAGACVGENIYKKESLGHVVPSITGMWTSYIHTRGWFHSTRLITLSHRDTQFCETCRVVVSVVTVIVVKVRFKRVTHIN